MNKDRRKRINEAVALINQAVPLLDRAKELIESAKDEEREFFDNMPENMQQGERGEQADNAGTLLEEAFDKLEELDASDLVAKLEEAAI